ncbi:MAG: hypothetical protein NC307_11240 [Roseburia sp.]|nr:hypothetical protein [Roseburia sp.]
MDSIITKIARKKMAEARNGSIQLPPIQSIALGDGGLDGDGNPIVPLEQDIRLNNELLRRDYDSVVRLSDTSFRYRIDLRPGELLGKEISEIALFDSEGDMLSIKTFLPKVVEADMEISFEIDDKF